MKQLFLIPILLLLCFAGFTKEKQLIINEEKVELVITQKTTKAQLKKFQKVLKEEANIDFNFKDIIVNSKNQINKITIDVNTNDGCHKTETLLVGAIYVVGFIRDYSITDTSSENALIIGNLREQEIKLD